MRVPIYIVIILCLLAAAAPWWIGTHNKDFVTPPNEAELKIIAEDWRSSQPHITAPKEALQKNDTKAPAKKTNTAKNITNPKLIMGDITTPPSLAEYAHLNKLGSASILNLAKYLETQKAPTRALLAWERVLDHTKPTRQERRLAQNAIARLTKKLPPWNLDSNADIKITLHAGASVQEAALITNTLDQVALEINQSSGYIIHVNTQKSIGTASNQGATSAPISLWFSNHTNQAIETPSIAIKADLTSPSLLKQQIKRGIYQIFQAHLEKSDSLVTLPDLRPDPKEKQQPLQYITRLMWRELAAKLQQPPSTPASTPSSELPQGIRPLNGG